MARVCQLISAFCLSLPPLAAAGQLCFATSIGEGTNILLHEVGPVTMTDNGSSTVLCMLVRCLVSVCVLGQDDRGFCVSARNRRGPGP